MNNNIVWKKFVIGDLFKRSGEFSINQGQKYTDISEEKTDEYTIALISSSRNNGGKIGYIKKSTLPNSNLFLPFGLTFDDQWGFTYFQNEDYVITGGHNANLIILNDKLKKVLDSSLVCYNFLANIINKITIKTGIFGYTFKINNKFEREYILLPCIECSKEESIWEDKYTLAVEYIESLMERAKERREEKTIKKYEAERKKYEAERKKYEADYLIEKNNVSWKQFKIGDLFKRSGEFSIKKGQKDTDISEEKTDEYVIALISSSRENGGKIGYIKQSELSNPDAFLSFGLTFDDQWGFTYFQNENHTITGGHNANLIILNDKLKNILDNSLICYNFLANIINKITIKTGIFGYTFKINNKFENEVILLPCIETDKENSIWEDKYTLATNYISYIYLSGRIKYCQRLIDNYTYRY